MGPSIRWIPSSFFLSLPMKKKLKLAVFIDGNNFRHGLKAFLKSDQIHWKTFADLIKRDYEVSQIKYYIGKITFPLFSENKVQEQSRLLRFLEKSQIETWLGYFTEQKQEKSVDVQIALDLAIGAIKKQYDSALLISGDGDLSNAVQVAQDQGVKVILGYIAGVKSDNYRISWKLKSKCNSQAALNRQVTAAHEKWKELETKKGKQGPEKKKKTSIKKSQNLLVFCDGGARGNPGPAGCGVAISDENGNVIKKISEFIGRATNNQAEYHALLLGLDEASKMKPKKITCYLDSQLVVNQVTNRWKVKNKALKEYHQQVMLFVSGHPDTDFHYIPREKNTLADDLANEAMDKGK